MNFSHPIIKLMKSAYIVFGTSLMLILALGIVFSSVSAQSSETWSEPTNLSQSGSARDPVMVVDSDGVFHVLWMDEFAGMVYVQGDGTAWSDPVPIVLPSKEIIPFLIADQDGFVHAFWRDEDNRFFYSKVNSTSFTRSTSWLTKTEISDSVLDFDLALDENGNLHLSYVNPLETEQLPAGVNYRQLKQKSSTWSPPSLIYKSPYFRSLDLESSNVDVSTSVVGEDARVFIVWDNRPRERVFLTMSDDNGETWSLPIEVDKPDEGVGTSGSSNIIVDAKGDQVLLLWQANRSGSGCEQFYQYSNDAGKTWSSRQSMFEGFVICPDEIQFLPIEDGTLLMLSGIEVLLQAWNGETWSEPQLQQPLSTFVDPDTQKLVEFGCQQPIVASNLSLFVLGCEKEIGKDIWLIERQLEDIPDWFPEEAVWSPVYSLIESDQRVASPVLVSDNLNRMHAIWSMANPVDSDGLGKMLYYARWEDGQWSRPELIVTSSDGKNEQPAAAVGAPDQLYVVWSGGIDGEIYFTKVDANQAVVSTSWRDPIRLPSATMVGSAPSVIVDSNGVIYVAYAIPLNDNRGIYLVRSEDEGQTWSDPYLVFNAQDAGWSMVDNPRLTTTNNGDLHILWTRSTLPSGQGSLSLYYSNSKDGGESWSNPQIVTENPVLWSQIVGVGEETVGRLWQEVGTIGTTLWHEQSLDNGQSWNRIAPVSVFGELEGNPSLFRDSSGRLHLILTVREGQREFVIQHWLYDGQRWSAEKSLEIEYPLEANIDSIVGNVSDGGELGVLLAGLLHEKESDLNQYPLNFYNRSIEVPSAVEIVDQQVTSTSQISVPTATAQQPTGTPFLEETEPTRTPIVFPIEPGQSSTPSWISFVGPILIGFIILIVIFIIYRGVRSWQS